MSWKPGPDDWASPDVTVLILQYVKSLIFESVCLACTVCLVLGHLPPQAVSASVRREMISLLFYNISLILVRAVQNEALSGCQRNTWSSQLGGEKADPFRVLLSSSPQRATLGAARNTPFPQARKQSYLGRSALLLGWETGFKWNYSIWHADASFRSGFVFLGLFFNLRLPKFPINLGLIEHLIGFWNISSYVDFYCHSFRLI